MNEVEKRLILSYYRNFLKLSKKINWYNYREYSFRKIQHDFRSNIYK